MIPRTYYSGESRSPNPIDSEEEETKKVKIRRWMVATKCADYDVAGVYLKGSDWELETAVEAYRGDERWEKENPIISSMRGGGGGKEKKKVGRRSGSMGLTGQLQS